MGACCRSGYPLSPCRPAPEPAPYAAAAEDAPPYPPAPPSLGLSCSSAGESKQEKQPIAAGQEKHHREAASIKGATFPPASALLCSAAEWGALIEPGGGWDRIFPARGSREGGRWGESEAKEGRGRKGAFFIGFLEGKRRERAARRVSAAAVWWWWRTRLAVFLLESIAARQGHGQPPS